MLLLMQSSGRASEHESHQPIYAQHQSLVPAVASDPTLLAKMPMSMHDVDVTKSQSEMRAIRVEYDRAYTSSRAIAQTALYISESFTLLHTPSFHRAPRADSLRARRSLPVVVPSLPSRLRRDPSFPRHETLDPRLLPPLLRADSSAIRLRSEIRIGPLDRFDVNLSIVSA